METPEEVVERELELWRLSQRDPDIMNGETLQEAERRRAYMMELQEASLRYSREQADKLRDAQRQMRDDMLAEMRRRHDAAADWQYNKPDYMAYRFPRITWRDVWLALRGL